MSQLLGVWTLTAALMALSACNRSGWDYWDQPDDPPVAVPSDDSPRVTMEIPHPINLLLPQRIDIHPFTRAQPTEANARGGGVLEVRIQLIDSFGDPGKGFGAFRFTLFRYRLSGVDRRGEQMVVWDEDLSLPNRNLAHWDPISNAYQFNLERDQPFVNGQRYVLEAYFDSPYTEQLLDEHAIMVGE